MEESRRPAHGERYVPTRDLRASDADRERVITLLGDALGDGRLTLTEHSERMERACAARTLGELTGLTVDLTPPEAQPIRVDSGSLHALFGSVRRTGRWVVPVRLPVLALFGSVELDLREAILQRKHIVIEASLLAGSITLLVPDGVHVNVTGRTMLATRDLRLRPAPDGPVIEISGNLILGTIKAAAPKRTWRQRVKGRIRRGENGPA
ncbi:DUF1707 SHOCT-like domain-containing protein [Actinomadura scrupuli]|uniref:DUF1707 SHOCT-like domain-containing protein n=1 Tax=Actinomadura scrupuli TaxID=559629 RepID=UPI003D968B7B